jgi:DNA mismatch repair protein MutL
MVARYPLTVLFIKIPPQEIDVNVHPAKAEVRFENSGKIFSMIHTAVRRTVTLHSPHTQFSPTMWQSYTPPGKTIDPAWNFAGETSTAEISVFSNHASLGNETSSSEMMHLPILRPIGQIGRKYIVSEGPDGIYLIDQHAAHERILFEKMYDSKKSEISSQLLLEPVVINLSPQMDELLNSNESEINEIGFQIQEFGQRTYRLEALPALLQHMDPKEALLSALEPDSEDDFIDLEKKSRIISRICKKAAIKAGQVLTFQEQEKLVRDLESCQSPRTCPHGRPTMIHLSVDVLERQFGRRGSL